MGCACNGKRAGSGSDARGEAMNKLPGIHIACVEDEDYSSKHNGTAVTYVVTPKRFWGLGLGATALMAMLRINSTDNAKIVTVQPPG